MFNPNWASPVVVVKSNIERNVSAPLKVNAHNCRIGQSTEL